MTIQYSELIKTLILDPIEFANGEEWLFKIEIFKHSQKGYFAQLYRCDIYDIKPTFAQMPNHIASESLWIQENYRFDMLHDVHYFADMASCQTAILKKMAKILIYKSKEI